MLDIKLIFHSFGLFYKFNPYKLISLFTLTLIVGLTQGVTIVLLIPLLGLLQPSTSTVSHGSWSDNISTILSKTGLETNLTSILLLFAFCMVIVAILNYFKTLLQSTYQQDFSYYIRKQLYRKVVASDWEFLNRKGKHNYIQVITTEIPKMSMYYYYYLDLTTKFIFILAHVVVAFFISIPFTLFVVFAGLLMLFSLSGYLRKASGLGYDNIQSFRSMLKKIDDFWMTVKLAKVHHSEQFYYRKFEESNEQMHDYQNRQIKNRALPQMLYTLAGVFFLILVVYLSYIYLHIPLTSMFVLIVLFGRIFPQFGNMNNDINMMVSNTASVKMVLEMDKEISIYDMEETLSDRTISVEKQIEFKDISFSYPDGKPILDHFSETIPSKSITGILGMSGCGKTTLLDILSGLLTIKGGILMIDGKTLTKNDLPFWRNGLGYLLQDSFFVDGTIRDNLVWDAKYSPNDSEIINVLRTVNADALVANLKNGLDTYITNYQYHFSGGEKQRLALARILLRKPEILLLDEATSALDSENEKMIMECLLNLKGDVTIVFVTHREYLKPYFDKTIVMK